jgi:Ca2+-binding EF-hand superfamily protein
MQRSNLSKALPLTALLLSLGLPALAQPASPSGADHNPMFNTMDTNADGRVTLDEVWARTQIRFTEADANRDGFLTQEEFRTLRRGPGDGPRRGPPGHDHAEHAQRMADARFRALDANRDSKVTLEEMRPQVEARFRAMDANGDQAVTREELPRPHHGGHHGARGPKPN